MKIALSGYYGFDNSGDEALLSAITSTIKKIAPEARFVVFSGYPGQTARLHGLRAVNRINPVSVSRELRESDLLISGGGSLFQDVTGPFSLPYYISIVALAKMLKKPVIFYAQGIGPVNRWYSKLLMRLIANRVDLITLRDEASIQVLQSLNITRPPVKVTADPVFSLEPSAANYEQMDKLLQELCPDASKVIGVSVRKWPQLDAYLPELASLLDMLKREGYTIMFIPLDYPDDLAASQRVADMMQKSAVVVDEQLTSQQHVALISKLDLVIGMRLHSLVFAATSGVPFSGISYDPKIDAFLDLFAFQALQGDAAILKEQIDSLLADEAAHIRSREKAQHLKHRAEETAHLALSLIKQQTLTSEE